MFIAKVKANIVSTVKHSAYSGRKLLIVRSINPIERSEEGQAIIAVDFVDAGIGDVVLVSQEGGTARDLLKDKKAPVRSFIVAIVENWDIADGCD